MRPVTVAPRRIAGGGLLSRTLTRNVPVTGSARGATSRTVPVATTFGSDVSATVISAIRRRGVLDARGHVEHGVAAAFARDLHDHASRRRRLRRARRPTAVSSGLT